MTRVTYDFSCDPCGSLQSSPQKSTSDHQTAYECAITRHAQGSVNRATVSTQLLAFGMFDTESSPQCDGLRTAGEPAGTGAPAHAWSASVCRCHSGRRFHAGSQRSQHGGVYRHMSLLNGRIQARFVRLCYSRAAVHHRGRLLECHGHR